MKLQRENSSTPTGKKLGISTIRHIVQVAVLVLFALPILVAGWALLGMTAPETTVLVTPENGIFYGSLSSSSILGIAIVDPFAALQVILASKSVTSALITGALIVIVVYGLIRARAFCGWVCPVNLFCEIIDWVRDLFSIQVKENPLPRHTKIWVAGAILVLSLIICLPVYEVFNPIGAINKFILFGSCSGLLTLIAIVIAELFYGHRIWCRSICPLGGFYEVLGRVGLVRVEIDHDACINCDKCKSVCICNAEILDPVLSGKENAVFAGDCMLCGKCVDTCPAKALKIGVGKPNLNIRN